jgi:hypothetical protein
VNLPYFWDKTPDTLPQPELNPLTNPVLERNLGRWAKAYFSNPPGQREQAISRLLQEIKSETSEILIAERAHRASSAWTVPSESAENRTAEVRPGESQDVICSTCRHKNPPGHRFCGQCGGGLAFGFSGRSYFAAGETLTAEPPAQPDNEVQWLRERALDTLYEADARAWPGWKYVLGSLAIALAVFAYLNWTGDRPASVASPAPSTAKVTTKVATPAPPLSHEKYPAPVQEPPEATLVHPKPSIPQLSEVQPLLARPEADDNRDPKASARVRRAAQKASLVGPRTTRRPLQNEDGGNSDLRLAQRYLGGNLGARDSAEAAKLLWRAVRQQNPTAAVLLSQMYARGDGVPKSCDQARILLLAAIRHGTPQAAEQLRNLESRGCR